MAATESKLKPSLARRGSSLVGQAAGLIFGVTVMATFFSLGFRLQHLSDPEPPANPDDASAAERSAEVDGPVRGQAAVEAVAPRPLPLTRRRRALRLVRRIVGLAFDAALVAAVVFAVFVAYGLINNRWYHVLVVKGASMTPTISAGDLVVITRPPDQIEPGMILTMEVDNSVVTHRVATVNSDGSFVTKGDANSVGDDFSANDVRVVGQVVLRIPLVGNLLPAGDPGPVTASGAWFSSSASLGASASSGTWSTPTDPTITVCAYDSTGAPIVLDSDQAWWAEGSSHYVGPVGASGCRESTVPAGDVTVWVGKDHTLSQQVTEHVTSDTTFNFYTTRVTLQYRAPLAFGGPNGDAASFSKPSMELFSDGVTPVRFRLDGTGGASGRIGLGWPVAAGPGATYTRSLIALRLVDSGGVPIDGGTARYQAGSWQFAPGSTGDEASAPGILAYDLPGLVGTVTNEMKLNGTTQMVTQDAGVNSVYQFQTRKLTLALETAGGDPLAGGNARYGIGSTYTSWWFPGGLTGVDGTSSAEVFPGTYSFEMEYQGTAETKVSVDIPDADTTLTWNTATVTLYYSGSLSYGGGSGDSAWFTQPTMNLLAGTYNFHFRDPADGGYVLPLTWGAGETYTKSMVIVHLDDASASGLSGGVIDYAPGGSWLPFGTTDGTGRAYLLVDGALGSIKVRVDYHNGSATQTDSQPTHSIFTFATVDATVSLLDHSGAGLSGGVVEQGGGSWIPVGTTDGSGNVTFALFPGSYKFRMTYNYSSVEITQDVSTPVVFQTGAVHSDSGNATQYSLTSWHTFTQDIELLPGKWHFKFSDATPLQYTIVAGTVNHIH